MRLLEEMSYQSRNSVHLKSKTLGAHSRKSRHQTTYAGTSEIGIKFQAYCCNQRKTKERRTSIMAKVSIQDIAKAIVNKHGLSQSEAENFVTVLFDVLNEGLHKEKIVKVKGLGTFKVIDVRERESVNVNTGERVLIDSHGK